MTGKQVRLQDKFQFKLQPAEKQFQSFHFKM